MPAATASSLTRSRRPPSPPFASFALPLGSLIVLASAMLDRSSKLLTGVTLPSSAARRKA